jgi:hypothetical protein
MEGWVPRSGMDALALDMPRKGDSIWGSENLGSGADLAMASKKEYKSPPTFVVPYRPVITLVSAKAAARKPDAVRSNP